MIATDELLARLTKLDTCAVSDALDGLGLGGATLGIRPLWDCPKTVGQAVTVRIKPVGSSPPEEHLGTSAIELAGPGEILVVDNGGRPDVACWGGLLSLAASLKGVSAVVIDGVCRDIDEIREAGFPIYARGVVPITARGRVMQDEVNGEVQCAGVTVQPGDLVIADGSGVVFLAAARGSEIVGQAEIIAQREQEMANAIRGGRSVVEVMQGYEGMLKDEEPNGSGGQKL